MFSDEEIYRRAPDAASEVSKDEYLVLDLRDGRYFGLDQVGQFVWEQMDGVRTVGEIAERISSRYGIGVERAGSDLRAFLADLVERNLIERDS